jgi:hypothetical protein
MAVQSRRLELTMCTRRCWSTAVFRERFVTHPLLQHLVRRLLFALGPETFRVCEDGSMAGPADEPITLHESATGTGIRIVHPLEIAPEMLAAWAALFGDYAIVQPFAQLGRDVHTPTEAEREATTLDRFAGHSSHGGPLLGLRHRGWTVDLATLSRRWPDGLAAHVPFRPGFEIEGDHAQHQAQTLGAVELRRGARPERLGALDPIAFSELVRDLASVARAPVLS